MSIPRSEDIVPPPLGPPRHLADGSKNGNFAALPSIKATAGTATSIRSIRIKNRNSHNGAVQGVTPNRNTTQDGAEVHLECKSKIQVSYTISEDMSGNCKKNILSRISKKKRDSRDVRLKIGRSYADRWSIRDRRELGRGYNSGVASSSSTSPDAASGTITLGNSRKENREIKLAKLDHPEDSESLLQLKSIVADFPRVDIPREQDDSKAENQQINNQDQGHLWDPIDFSTVARLNEQYTNITSPADRRQGRHLKQQDLSSKLTEVNRRRKERIIKLSH
ncbi:hypothetical protein O988_03594 [Pseudogymnoascus sp. VKM F-3808]|nr:hypothetical protein O988_03594 [Pseudogymnoascus sp. VKM F-3808]